MRCTRFHLLLLLVYSLFQLCRLTGIPVVSAPRTPLTFLTRSRYVEPLCHGSRPGDCDPDSCGGTCESRYIRFFDRSSKKDRTAKSCQCVQERICSIIGMHSHAGCRSYSSLSAAGQRLIRLWSIDARERRYRFSNDVKRRFSDKQRHHQLMNGNSRFCCRSITPKRTRSLRLLAGTAESRATTIILFFIAHLLLR